MLNVDNEEIIEPPIQTLYFLYFCANTFTSIVAYAKSFNSDSNLSGKPTNQDVPPDKIIFANKSFLTSISHLFIDLKVKFVIPGSYFPFK